VTVFPQIDEFVFSSTEIDGLFVISPRSVTDERGEIRELFRKSVFTESIPGFPSSWAQVNLTRTKYGAVRGLHAEAMTKLVTVAYGGALGVYVDVRPDSSSRGKVVTVDLRPGRQVLVPQGVCNGFQATAEGGSEYLYFFDPEWQPTMAGTSVNPLDDELDIQWPIPIDPDNRDQISAKDAAAPTLAEVLAQVPRVDR
jgi:dTDP-4-dehydrorhamnose 3,5-epimerase